MQILWLCSLEAIPAVRPLVCSTPRRRRRPPVAHTPAVHPARASRTRAPARRADATPPASGSPAASPRRGGGLLRSATRNRGGGAAASAWSGTAPIHGWLGCVWLEWGPPPLGRGGLRPCQGWGATTTPHPDDVRTAGHRGRTCWHLRPPPPSRAFLRPCGVPAVIACALCPCGGCVPHVGWRACPRIWGGAAGRAVASRARPPCSDRRCPPRRRLSPATPPQPAWRGRDRCAPRSAARPPWRRPAAARTSGRGVGRQSASYGAGGARGRAQGPPAPRWRRRPSPWGQVGRGTLPLSPPCRPDGAPPPALCDSRCAAARCYTRPAASCVWAATAGGSAGL